MHVPTRRLLGHVAKAHRIELEALLGPSRGKAPVARARRTAMVLLRALGLSLPEIGRALGRQPETVHHGLGVAGRELRAGGLAEARLLLASPKTPPPACGICGCTSEDCRRCVQRTGEACSWVAPGICSACSNVA